MSTDNTTEDTVAATQSEASAQVGTVVTTASATEAEAEPHLFPDPIAKSNDGDPLANPTTANLENRRERWSWFRSMATSGALAWERAIRATSFNARTPATSTETATKSRTSPSGTEATGQVQVAVVAEAATNAEAEAFDLPEWLTEETDEFGEGVPASEVTVDLGNRRERRAWWRSMSTSAALATLAWQSAIRGTSFRALTRQSGQWIVVVVAPSDAWFRPIKDVVGLQHRAHFHDAIPQTRRRLNEETEIDCAVRLQKSIFVMATDLRNSPPAIRSTADLTIVIPPPNIDLVRRLLLRTGRGTVPRNLDPSLIAGLDFADFCTAIRPGRRVSETLAALKGASADRVSVPAEAIAPALGSTRAFGAAGLWGQQLALDIADYRAGKIAWSDVDRGAVVYGPPGTGKTLFARSLAQHCKLPIVLSTVSDYFATSAGDLDSVIKAQREVFQRAFALKPAILFLDEIDSIPDRNSLSPRGRDWWMPVINDFLTLLDSATSTRAGVVVIGATNRIEAIDPALLRAGRLERAIELGLPDPDALVDILRHHLGGQLASIDLLPFARLREGTTGAQAMEWVRAGRRTARSANRPLELADLEAASSDGAIMSPSELRRAAIHEAGHAVAVMYQGRTIASISLDPSGPIGGRFREAHPQKHLMTRQDMIDQCTVLLAGRAAEEVLLRAPSTGAGGSARSDLARATELILWAHRSLGLGNDLVYGGPPTPIETSAIDPSLRPTIARELADAYTQALDIVRAGQAQVQAIATALIDKRFLSGDEVDKILSNGGDLASKV